MKRKDIWVGKMEVLFIICEILHGKCFIDSIEKR